MESRRPVSNQPRTPAGWAEGDISSIKKSRVPVELTECVETKTITTTTTTQRSYPGLVVQEPRHLHDIKEYPLAARPVPPKLRSCTYSAGPNISESWTLGEQGYLQRHQVESVQSESTSRLAIEAVPVESTLSSRTASRTPSDASGITRRSQTSAAASPSRTYETKPTRTSTRSQTQSSPGLPNVASDRLRQPEPPNSSAPQVPATPDPNDSFGKLDRPSRPRPTPLSTSKHGNAPEESPSYVAAAYDPSSPSEEGETQPGFSLVATPPITDADPGTQFGEGVGSSRGPPRPFRLEGPSLPSPRLSPTLRATALSLKRATNGAADDDVVDEHEVDSKSPASMDVHLDTESLAERQMDAAGRRRQQRIPTIFEARDMIEMFDSMPADMKTFVMYQFLRRCPRKTLHMVVDVVNPALKCDFLKQLPLELSLHVLSYLDHRDLCRAAQVSKHWRNIVDSNETGWKELFDRDGFVLPPGELEKAIAQGWGWQDPVGPEGCELDLSLQSRMTSSETDLIRSTIKVERDANTTTHNKRNKRKRGVPAMSNAERSKRRAGGLDAAKDDKSSLGTKLHRSEGPMSAANAAALAVPDPHIGLSSLRKLHLFKSLYRRHYMIRQNWTSGKVKPSHMAFAAHPRHVITCLQFDEDKIVTGSDDTLIHVYDTKTGALRKKLEGHEGGVWALQYEGNTLVSGSTDRSVRVWDIEKGLCTQVFYGHTSTVRCLQILMPTPTGKLEDGKPVMMPPKPLIITGSRDRELRVWRLPEAGSRRYIQTGPPANDADCPYFIRTLHGHQHSVRAIAAHGDTLVSGSYDSTVRVWRISTGEQVHVLQGHTQKVYSVVLDHERNRCISGSMDSLVRIWDLETGACLHTLEGHSLLVGLLDLRDGRLVSAAADSTLRIWDPETGKCRSTLMAHTGAITCFQHDGRKVISGSEKTVKMWDIRTGECIQDLLSDLSGVWQVKFDGRRCVAAVQRDGLTYVEILDFGAVRDGKRPEELGKRQLLNPTDVQRIIDEEL